MMLLTKIQVGGITMEHWLTGENTIVRLTAWESVVANPRIRPNSNARKWHRQG